MKCLLDIADQLFLVDTVLLACLVGRARLPTQPDWSKQSIHSKYQRPKVHKHAFGDHGACFGNLLGNELLLGPLGDSWYSRSGQTRRGICPARLLAMGTAHSGSPRDFAQSWIHDRGVLLWSSPRRQRHEASWGRITRFASALWSMWIHWSRSSWGLEKTWQGRN